MAPGQSPELKAVGHFAFLLLSALGKPPTGDQTWKLGGKGGEGWWFE